MLMLFNLWVKYPDIYKLNVLKKSYKLIIFIFLYIILQVFIFLQVWTDYFK